MRFVDIVREQADKERDPKAKAALLYAANSNDKLRNEYIKTHECDEKNVYPGIRNWYMIAMFFFDLLMLYGIDYSLRNAILEIMNQV